MATLHEHALALGLAALALVAVLWWLWRRGRPQLRHHSPDALDEGAAPALRNQAFIDAPSASAATTAVPDTGGEQAAGTWPVDTPAPEAPAPETPSAERDELTRIKGVGPKLSARLAELGVTRFAQIAAWSDADLARIDGALGAFAGRPARDEWVAQCRLLAAGDLAGYEARFGRL